MNLKLGSLFDGSGGFPLAGLRHGITPVWLSEVEPFPILVTTTRFPHATHLGDVAAINGAEVEPVDIVTFGSPCQDLSIAGLKAGLAGSRSGLFFHAVRIIKEMRRATHGLYPRYAVWENVPGAFSSNKGADFHRVLQALISVTDEQAAHNLPRIPKWERAGAIVGDGWSIAWRVLGAQYFGVPQRRKRIFLVADFTSTRAGHILFEPQSLPRDPQTGCDQRQTPPSDPVSSSRTSIDTVATVYGFNAIHADRGNLTGRYGYEVGICKTLDTTGIAPTCNQGGVAVVDTVLSASKSDFFCRANLNIAGALLATDAQEPPIVTEPQPSGYRIRRLTPLECCRLQGFPDDWTDGLAIPNPTEAELDYWWTVWSDWATLQGLKKSRTRQQVRAWLASPVTDRALYKLWGNGIALPCAELVLGRIGVEAAVVY